MSTLTCIALGSPIFQISMVVVEKSIIALKSRRGKLLANTYNVMAIAYNPKYDAE